jgi:hypothetical protein
MSFDFGRISDELLRTQEGVSFVPEAVSLVGCYDDELSAHRNKKRWGGVFKDHFLLEARRDYEMRVTPVEGEGRYALICNFTSACGRYAFWRLVNQQSPEVERALGLKEPLKRVSYTTESFGVSAPSSKNQPSWVLSSLTRIGVETRENAGLIARLLKLF